MMKHSHARVQYYKGVGCLVGSGSIQNRLKWACISIMGLRHDEMNDEQWDRHASLLARMTQIQDEQEGSIAATAARLSEEEALAIATETLSLFNSFCDGRLRE